MKPRTESVTFFRKPSSFLACSSGRPHRLTLTTSSALSSKVANSKAASPSVSCAGAIATTVKTSSAKAVRIENLRMPESVMIVVLHWSECRLLG